VKRAYATPDSDVTYLFHDLHTSYLSCTDSGCKPLLTSIGWYLDQWTRVCNKQCRLPTGQIQGQFTLRLTAKGDMRVQ